MPPFLLPLIMNRYTVGAVIALGLILGAYWKGYSAASARCHDAELRAIIATQARDLKAWEAADSAAKDEQARLAAEMIELQNMVTDYEKELLLKPVPACSLTPDDVRALERVRGNGRR
jgi:hypothetical protein